MNLIEFIKEYPDESSCKAKFKQYRDHLGVCVCKSLSNYYTTLD